MARYIDADSFRKALIDRQITDCYFNYERRDEIGHIVDLLDKAPTADVVEVRHGEWIQLSEPHLVDGIKQLRVECPNCKIQRYIPAIEQHGYYYCPNCGAKMDGGKAK